MEQIANRIVMEENRESSPLLVIEGLVAQYKTERATNYALNGVNLALNRGESLGLVGESGAGKTTTALSILNLLPEEAAKVMQGDIRFNGKSVFKMSKRELMDMRGDKAAMIFQNPLTALNPVFTVGEQIAMVLRKHRNMGRRQAIEEAKRLLKMVGIPEYRVHDYPVQYSGGMRQRVGIAAGLACNPELLIADEPTTALDVTIQAQILDLMKNMQAQYATALLMITHNLGIVAELCEKVAVMYAGRIIEYGTVREVFSRPAHPYTMGLMNALPKLSGPRNRLSAIPGRVVDPQNLPEGCSFHPRCKHCTKGCTEQYPPMVEIDVGHFVCCYHGMA